MNADAVEIAEDLKQFVQTIATTGPLKKDYQAGVFKCEFQFCSPKVNNGKVIVAAKENITVVLDNEIFYSTNFFDARRNLIMKS
jgi:hypothetical protein